MKPLLEVDGLDVGVGARLLVRGLSFEARPGEMTALLGQNGVGKTLTLHALAGLRHTRSGTVRLRGADVRLLEHRERALRIGLLLQDHDDPFPTSVLETALIGRHARLGLFQWETAEDHRIALNALREVDLDGTGERLAATLSGGERRRLGLATLLVQDPEVLLLDEPLNHLDPRHQFAVLATLRDLARQGKAVIASLHDPVLAARHFDSALLLHGNGRWRFGAVGELLSGEVLSDLYAVPFERYRRDSAQPATVMLPAPGDESPASGRNVTPLRRRFQSRQSEP